MSNASHQEFDSSPLPVSEFSQALAMARQLTQSGEMTERQAENLSHLAAAQFWAHYLTEDFYLSDAVTVLCEIATGSRPALARHAQKALFSDLVERLSDAFAPAYVALYDRMFAQVIDCCRRTRPGAKLDARLSQFGLYTARDLEVRRRQARARPPQRPRSIDKVKKVLFLSRVTLGAEVAITATLMARLLDALPGAQCVLLAAPSMQPLFAGTKRISVRGVPYDRNKGLIEQFSSWLEVVRLISAEVEGLQRQEYLVVDPDSRFAQLGMLPVVADESNYLFFESRTAGQTGTECIGRLASDWATRLFGGAGCVYPALSLATRDWEFAETLRYCLREAGAAHVAVINFGVGGNPDKRLAEDFERELVAEIVASGSRVLLAEGVGQEEMARSNRLLAHLAAAGTKIARLDTTRSYAMPQAEDLECDLVAWRGNIGTYCALIGTAEEYVGYDSGGQHVAAALGTPTIDIFAHSPYPLFAHRWTPYGPGRIAVVDATQRDLPGPAGSPDVIRQVLAYHQEHKTARRMGAVRIRPL